MEADWSQLPSELLQLISKKLDNEIYLLQFHSVCSTWRSSSIPNHKHKNPLPLNLPQFPQPNSNRFFNYLNSKYTTSHLIKHTFFLIKPPQHQPSLNPWLIRIGPDLNDKPRLWHPFSFYQRLSSDFNNVLDFNKLSLRVLGHMSYMHLIGETHQDFFSFYVASVCRGEQRHVLIALDLSHEPMMFRCGDDSWTMIPNMPTSQGGDACVFKGRPCVVDKTGRTFMIGPDLTTHLIAGPVFGGQSKFLVESSEFELLLVDIYEDDDLINVVWIDVFKLDEKEKKWVKLTDLGDRVLFVGNGCSFSTSASELGFANGNCVIYGTFSIHVFHLDQGQVSPLSDYPEYIKLFWPPPAWVTDLHL